MRKKTVVGTVFFREKTDYCREDDSMFQARIHKLQQFLTKEKIDYFLFADADGHFSEYVGDYYKMRTVFSGFTGSNGTLLVGRDAAYLWTDGRYFIQAEKELVGSGISLMKMGMPDVPSVSDFILQLSKNGMILGVDSAFLSYQTVLLFREKFGDKTEIKIYKDILRTLLTDEDGMEVYSEKKVSPISILSAAFQDNSVADRIEELRNEMKKEKVQAFFSGKLDTNMWFMGIRGNDIAFNPYAFSYMLITHKKAYLMVFKEAVTQDLKKHCEINGVELECYQNVSEILADNCKDTKVASTFDFLNAYIADGAVQSNITWVDSDCGLALKQAVKTKVEIAALKEIYRKDSAAVCKFLCWLAKQKPGTVTEYQAAIKMNALRSEIPEFKDLSFSTISAYGPNAAMMHYEPHENNSVYIKEGNVFLIDSGGQYEGGTTDVTRTVAIGAVSDKVKSDYTAVLKGMLALQNAHFMYGCTGMNLDILARTPIWEKNLNYNCGTGHGIGFMLGVHEGPQAIRTKGTKPACDTPLMAGMLVSDEPGIYREGEYGIRVENILLCKEVYRTEEVAFMEFEPLTLVPIDINLVHLQSLTEKEKKQVKDYQELVCDEMARYLTAEEQEWLQNQKKIL